MPIDSITSRLVGAQRFDPDEIRKLAGMAQNAAIAFEDAAFAAAPLANAAQRLADAIGNSTGLDGLIDGAPSRLLIGTPQLDDQLISVFAGRQQGRNPRIDYQSLVAPPPNPYGEKFHENLSLWVQINENEGKKLFDKGMQVKSSNRAVMSLI